MKKEILLTVNSLLRRTFTSTVLICALIVACFPVTAVAQKYTFEKSIPEIKYLGVIQDKLVFQIDLEKASESSLFVHIRDDSGNTLFTERVRNKTFSRKFAIAKDEFENGKLSFVIQDVKGNTDQTFKISRNTRIVEDVVITRQ